MKNTELVVVSKKELREIISQEIQNGVKKITPTSNKSNNDLDLDLMTRKEVMEVLKINSTTLHRWQRDKVLSSYSIGYRIYFKKSEIVKLLNDNKIS